MHDQTSKFGSVPKLWPGSTIYIIGGGPSVKTTPLELIHNKYVIGCNNAYLLGSWVDVLFFGDCKWYLWHTTKYRKQFSLFRGLIVSCCSETIDDPEIITLDKVNPDKTKLGFPEDTRKIAWFTNTGATAINVAYLLGATKVVLIGFDMRIVDGKINYHGDHVIKVKDKKMNEELFPKFLKHFDVGINRAIKNTGIEVVNATPGSALTTIPIVNLEDVV